MDMATLVVLAILVVCGTAMLLCPWIQRDMELPHRLDGQLGLAIGSDPAESQLLSEMLDREWPHGEYLAVGRCPRLDLDPWETKGVARGHLRRLRRTRGRWRYLLWRVRHCQCGSWHVQPWITLPRRTARPPDLQETK